MQTPEPTQDGNERRPRHGWRVVTRAFPRVAARREVGWKVEDLARVRKQATENGYFFRREALCAAIRAQNASDTSSRRSRTVW